VDLVVSPDDPMRTDVRELLAKHLDFSHDVTPAGHVHALDLEALLDPSVCFYSARRDGQLLGVGALRHLDVSHAEIKSMHTAEEARRSGVGRAMVQHLLAAATELGCERVSLETGTMDAFLPARTLYTQLGFKPCQPFGSYTANPHSICMTIILNRG
jgi:putative acetyltransferase